MFSALIASETAIATCIFLFQVQVDEMIIQNKILTEISKQQITIIVFLIIIISFQTIIIVFKLKSSSSRLIQSSRSFICDHLNIVSNGTKTLK